MKQVVINSTYSKARGAIFCVNASIGARNFTVQIDRVTGKRSVTGDALFKRVSGAPFQRNIINPIINALQEIK